MTERSKSRAMAIPGGGNRQRLDHSESFPMQEQSTNEPALIPIRISPSSKPESFLMKECVVETPDSFKRLILNQSTLHTMFSLAPILLLINGLPQSGKSETISKLLKTQPLNIPLPDRPPPHGLSLYELAAVAVLEPTNNSSLDYIESTAENCYQYIFKSALLHREKLFISHITWHNDQFNNKFKSEVLNSHLLKIFKQLQETKMSDSWERCAPDGMALINIWDISHKRAIYHFLPALSGLLYNSYSWLFFDLERDGPNFDKLPVTDGHTQLMKWKSRINYLLRAAKLNESKKRPPEEVCCSVFAADNNSTSSSQNIVNDEFRGKLTSTASKLGVKELVDTHNITIINPSNSVRLLSAASNKLVFERLSKKIEVPLSFIFLRSLYYENDKILYIKRQHVKMLAEELCISSGNFQWFCELFTSLGSIIDVSLIDEESQYIILKPNLFLQKFDKIFNTDNQLLTKYGIFTSSLAVELFGSEHAEAYTEILVSLDLAVSLTQNQIVDHNNIIPIPKLWYLPDMCTNAPLTDTTEPAKNTLRMLRGLDAPHSHLQVAFVKKFLKSNPSSKLCVRNNDRNVTTIEVLNTQFDVVYFGYTLEFRVSQVNRDIFTQIIQTCHDIMNEKKHEKTKYNFAVMCSNVPPKSRTADLYELTRDRHLLPDHELCGYCRQKGRHEEEYLHMWNEVLKGFSVPYDRELNGNAILLENAEHVAQKMQPSYLAPTTIDSFFKKLGDPSTIPNLKDWQLPMMKLIQWESQLEGIEAKNPKRALAKKLMEVAYENNTPPKDSKTLQEIVHLIDSEAITEAKGEK